MSLLVINSSSRVARGIIKGFAQGSGYNKIVCADLLPNYKAMERFINLRGEVSNASILEDVKIHGKSGLEGLLERAKDVVYVTHDYYHNVPSKTSMFQNVVEMLAKQDPSKKVDWNNAGCAGHPI